MTFAPLTRRIQTDQSTAQDTKLTITHIVRPDHLRLAGVPLAALMPVNFYKAILPSDLDAVVAYLRSVKPVRNEVADAVYKAPVHRDAYPDAETGFTEAALRDPVKQGAYLVTLGHAWSATPPGNGEFPIISTGLGKAAGNSLRRS